MQEICFRQFSYGDHQFDTHRTEFLFGSEVHKHTGTNKSGIQILSAERKASKLQVRVQ